MGEFLREVLLLLSKQLGFIRCFCFQVLNIPASVHCANFVVPFSSDSFSCYFHSVFPIFLSHLSHAFGYAPAHLPLCESPSVKNKDCRV